MLESTVSTGPERLVMLISLSTSDMLSLKPLGISVVADTSGPLGCAVLFLWTTQRTIPTRIHNKKETATAAMMYTYMTSNSSEDKNNALGDLLSLLVTDTVDVPIT